MAGELGPNRDLIGISGGRARLCTPALVLDLDVLDRNLAAMAAHCRGAGLALRPHAKSHKSVAIARRQIEAGAIGICCATIREAEAMVGAGIAGVLITSPVTGPAKVERLMALHTETDSLMVVTDGPDNADALARAAARAVPARPLAVVVDFDVGLHRTGAATEDEVAVLAQRIEDCDSLAVAGVQAYAGHLQHVADFDERAAQMTIETGRLRAAVARLAEIGLEPAIVTGGGTGTHDIDHRDGVFTELQAGSYVFTDVQYNAVALRRDQARPFEPALFVQASVVSTVHDSHAVIDAGLKSFATDGPAPVFSDGVADGVQYQFMGDEHGAVVYGQVNERLKVGEAVSCLVPHCDPTVNLYDHYHCVQGDTLVDIWPVDARGNP
ncbi:MAG: DSD1 family PLP-dependent enzyme [Alphaproteobacteria bacterium]|jgi:D-serine deaminase-like pyridoxal phosphate-dependent protein|nr:DSD1 family PLP-dependent enzyme [Alphaproteobacteria bacterium]MDP6515284.1 DSD1 family PLP-dependent enzyme [Alphaproteobacteria bacterium]